MMLFHGNAAAARAAASALMLIALLTAPTLASGQVRDYFSHEEALALAYPNGEQLVELVLLNMISFEERKQLARDLKQVLNLGWARCYQVQREGRPVGYLFIDEAFGKEKHMTYLLKVDHPSGRIARYEIMVYRETVGGNHVRKGPFRQQFYGKTVRDPLEYGVDLRSVSGATLSANGLLRAFRKNLTIYDRYLQRLPPQTP